MGPLFRKSSILFLAFSFIILYYPAWASDNLKPYKMGRKANGEFKSTVIQVKNKLLEQGFEIAGEYTPYKNAYLIIITDAELKKAAAMTEFGGYGVAQRVAVTKVDDELQVSYTNPEYMANIYRLKGDLKGVVKRLGSALGYVKDFGSENGFNADDLREYHYMMFMPYFTDQLELVKHESHEAAISAVEKGLSSGQGGSAKVFRIDIPGKKQSLFGVALNEGASADKAIMEVVDTGELKHTAHLPYELLVSGSTVYALHGKFRIAQSFPDLTMGTFMKISSTPNAIEEALRKLSGL